MDKICCFAGHRFSWRNGDIDQKVLETVEKLILDGFNVFYDGNHGDFDETCSWAVEKLKNKYPNVKLILVITHYRYKKENFILPKRYDGSIYPDLENVYPKRKIIERNKWMVDNCDVLVARVTDELSVGAYKTVKYAQKKNKRIIFI